MLYICEVEISPTAAPGEYALAGSRIVASDPEGFAIERVIGIDGAIVVQEAPTPVPTATPVPCVGDCNGDGEVTVDELLTMVNIALGNLPVTACPAASRNTAMTPTTAALIPLSATLATLIGATT